jgi:hypothetical protein
MTGHDSGSCQRKHEGAMGEIERLKDRFPEWDFHELFGNFFAVPAGTPLLPSSELDDLKEKVIADNIRERGMSTATEETRHRHWNVWHDHDGGNVPHDHASEKSAMPRA